MASKYPDSYYRLTEEETKLVEEKFEWFKIIAQYWDRKLKGVISYDDLTQIAGIGFIKCLKAYNPNKGKFEVYAKYYMMGEIIKEVKKIKTRTGYETPLHDLNELIIDNTFEEIVEEQIIYDMYKNINLPNATKKVIDLYLIKKYTRPEIAKILNISRQAIEQHIRRFEKECKKYLQEKQIA